MLDKHLHALLSILCTLHCTQLLSDACAISTRHPAAPCTYRGIAVDTSVRALPTLLQRDNNASCMLQNPADHHSMISWANNHAAMPTAAVPTPPWANFHAEQARIEAISTALSATWTAHHISCWLHTRRAYCSAAAQPIDFIHTVDCQVVTFTAVTHAQMNDAWHSCGNNIQLYTHTPSLSPRQIVCFRQSMYTLTASSTQQSLNKDRLQLRTAWVHIAGFKGDRDQMQAQLAHLREQFPLPFTSDAPYRIDGVEQPEEGALAAPASKPHLLSSFSKRSVLLALVYECVFVVNTDTAFVHCQPSDAVFPLRMVSSLPAPAGHKGHTPTLIVQP